MEGGGGVIQLEQFYGSHQRKDYGRHRVLLAAIADDEERGVMVDSGTQTGFRLVEVTPAFNGLDCPTIQSRSIPFQLSSKGDRRRSIS